MTRALNLGKCWIAVLGAALALALAGCRNQDKGEVQVVVIGEAAPRLADPAAATLSAPDLVLVENAAQGLVRFDAAGNVAPGLAERWAVSNDGLSYTFRLRKGEWSDGRRVRARDVVRLLQRHLTRASRNPLKDTVGAVSQVVAMTDRVVAIELSSARPHLLQLLAQPEFGLLRERAGTGPFAIEQSLEGVTLIRSLPAVDGAAVVDERVRLASRPAAQAVDEFIAGRAEVVLGGTSGDLALALGAKLPRGALRIDPVAGLFGLVPARADGPAGNREVRALLDEAIDRTALVAALGLPQLQPRASLLQPGLDGIAAPAQPEWAAQPLLARRAGLLERAARLFPPADRPADGADPPARPVIRVALPQGPGGAILLQRLQADWGALGLDVAEPQGRERPDFRWVDAVAPSLSPAWYLRNFRCGVVPVCLPDADRLLDAARLTGFPPQRNAFFAEAERQMRAEVLFIPVAAPIRWSLAGRSLAGFAENRFARHSLTDLRGAGNTRD